MKQNYLSYFQSGGYIVKQNDTLSKIAKQYGVTIDDLVSANNIKNKNLIRVGQNLVIPTRATEQEVPTTVVVKENVPDAFGGNISVRDTFNILNSKDEDKAEQLFELFKKSGGIKRDPEVIAALTGAGALELLTPEQLEELYQQENTPKKPVSFKEAFRQARIEGKQTFTWNGKKYSTDLAKATKIQSVPQESRRIAFINNSYPYFKPGMI